MHQFSWSCIAANLHTADSFLFVWVFNVITFWKTSTYKSK